MNRDDAFDYAPLTEPERYELDEGPAYRFDFDRRDFVKTLGGGLLVLMLLDPAEAQQRGGRGARGRSGAAGGADLAARLHVAESGEITVYTSKTEVGQNIRTSLAQAIAEELRVDPLSIKMVMADTDLVPDDGGTAGSRSTPDTAQRLRTAGAAAREALIDLAAAHWKVDRGQLSAADGQIARADTGEAIEYGKLTQGQRLTRTIQGNPPLTPAREWKVAGQSLKKVNGRDVVTGKHQHTADLRLDGMLFGKVLRPPSYGATLVSADTQAAQELPGVTVVRDGDFMGVAAPTELEAERALAEIKAKWRATPQISHKELFDELQRTGGAGGGGRGGATRGGSVERGLAEADVKSEATYTIAYIAHAPLEPRAAVAEWTEGKLTVWTGTQQPARVRGELASAFRIGQDDVRVIVPDTGSGYGGKHTGEAAVEAARISRAAKRPVKLVWTREEEFTWAYFRPAGVITVNGGAKKDGTLTAWDFHNYNSGGSGIRMSYDVPNQVVETHSARSPLRQGSYRGLASAANCFARETHMDDLAHAAGIDPLEFRLKNLRDQRLRAVFVAAAKAFGWEKGQPGKPRGIGLGGGTEKGSYVATCAEVEVDPQGRVKVLRATSAFECGAVVNPDQLENQVEGCMMMGLGGALFEAIEFENGKILNAGFSTYRVPRFRDTPEMEVVLLDRKDLPSAGAGETPIVGIAPAIGNAIFAATGVRLRTLPMAAGGVTMQ
ncbi:MAG: molybdopterin cofactor-binding domain-containing protein [Planctomycetaceae bacterium]